MASHYIGELKKGFFEKYGVCWDAKVYDAKKGGAVLIEFAMFGDKMAKRMPYEQGGVTPEVHFKKLAKYFWPEKDGIDASGRKIVHPVKFIWNDWADLELTAMCQTKYLSIAGSAGSGKSEIGAIWLIINWLCDPKKTLCIATSTSLSAARGRIWGKIVKYWTPLEKMGFPGKLVDSQGTIVYVDRSGKSDAKTEGNTAAIMLIAGEKKKGKEAVGKMIGLHNDTVIFLADELPELSEAIQEAAWSNMDSGSPVRFQFIGIGNPKSYTDAFGIFAKPKAGWESISVEDERWETEFGTCIHLDDLKNPNFAAGQVICPWMLTPAKLDAIPESQRNSSSFWRMKRGFWCPTGDENSIYSDIEIVSTKSDQPAVWLDDRWVWVAALDPAFTTGGDRPMATFGKFGNNAQGLPTLCVCTSIELEDNVNNKDETFSEQIIKKFRAECEKRNISPRNIAYDGTGAGISFGHLMSMIWSKDILKVDFGGAASDMPVSAYDSTPAKERYKDRVSELWYGAKEYLRTGQVRGIHPSLQTEMCSRFKSEEKTVSGLRFRVESKREMKARIGRSCDESDSFFIMVELCRQRLGFSSKQGAARVTPSHAPSSTFKELFRRKQNIYKPHTPDDYANAA